MSLAKTASPATMPRLPWLHIFIIALLMVSRRPDAILHPQFWAEDGQVFYHDAYTYGLPALWRLQDGYFQTLSRLTSLCAAQFPLLWGPAIFASVAGVFQLLPVIFLLSRRMDAAIPSWTARLALTYFYAAMPNSFELNLNITNAQWHLALLAFLVVASTPPRPAFMQTMDKCVLLLFGLSGPFAVFLLPIAIFRSWRVGSSSNLANAAIITVTAFIQATAIVCSHATSARLVTPLGASVLGLGKIMVDNVLVGGLLGDGLMTVLVRAPMIHATIFVGLISAVAVILIVVAMRNGPAIYREFLIFGTLTYAAALFSPVSSVHETLPQWIAMARPGYGMRYVFIPSLIWFATLIVLLNHRSGVQTIIGFPILFACLFGIYINWKFPPFRATNFSQAAMRFDQSMPGTEMTFPENPPGWAMTLSKH